MDLVGTSPKTLAVITGAYGGTGRAVARRLGARYRLVLAGRDEAKVAGLSESLVEEGYDVALAVTADVTSRQNVKHLASGPKASSSSAVPVRLTATTVSQGAWSGDSPAVCTRAPSVPASAVTAARCLTFCVLVTSAVTARATS